MSREGERTSAPGVVALVRLFLLLFYPLDVSGCHHACGAVRRLASFGRHDGHAVNGGEVQRLQVSLHLNSTDGHCLEHASVPRTPHVEVRVHRTVVRCGGGVDVGRWLVVMDGKVARGVVTG